MDFGVLGIEGRDGKSQNQLFTDDEEQLLSRNSTGQVQEKGETTLILRELDRWVTKGKVSNK